MSLLVWLPLIKDTKNQGLSDPTITTTGTITYSAGKIGNALTFNNSALTLKPAPLNTSTKEFSFAFWFKPTSTNSYQCLYNGRTAVGGAIAIFRDPSNLWRFDDGTQKTFNFGTVVNEWHHYAFTRDESNVKLYIDGVLKQTMTASSFTCETASASIGMSSVSNTTPGANPIIGQLNDYRIYNHCLSKREVKELAKGLCLHVPLDWGANPNMIKQSYTFMNKNLGSNNASGAKTKTVFEDDTAPCHWVFKCQIQNTTDSAIGANGVYYGVASQGLELTDLTENEYYTYSFWAKSDSGLAGGLGAGAIVESQTLVSYTGFGNLDRNWRKHIVTFKWTKTTKLTACFYVTAPASSTVDFQVCGFKLEKGQKATPYVPHVEEAAYTNNGYATKYLQDCSGYNNEIKAIGSNNVSCTSPKGLGGTTCGAGSAINLGRIPKLVAPFTFAFWFNTTDLTYNNNRLVSCTENGGWNIELNGNYLCFTTGTGASSNTYKYCISTKTYTELQGAWHYIACAYDGLKAQMYLDGVLDKETTHFSTFTPIYYNANNAVFLCAESGANATTPASTYAVLTSVSDFRMYATTLSADDIKALYNIGAEIDKSGKLYCNQLVEE